MKQAPSLCAATAVVCGLVFAATGLTGCGSGVPTPLAAESAAAVAVTGSVHGGQQAVTGSTMQLYAVGLNGSTASTPLLTSTVKTDGNGYFSLSGKYTCPSSSSQVYLVATGGNPGLANGTNNAQLALMSALGSCGNLTSSSFVIVNEVTTVAAVASLSSFMTSYQNVGSSAGQAAALAAAFTVANELANVATGTAPGENVPSGYTTPADKLNGLADVAAACVNSAGGTAGDGTLCGKLLGYATPSGGSAPANVIDALLDVANHPTLQVSSIYGLTPANAPFQPALTSAPTDWNIALLPNTSVTTDGTLVGVGTTLNGTVSLVQAAPAGGLSVALTSSSSAVTVSSPITIAAGQSSGTFSYTGSATGDATITAKANGYGTSAATVTGSAMYVSLGSLAAMAPGAQTALNVTLSAAAPAGGLTVSLASSNSAVATISPATVAISAGQTSPATSPMVTGVTVGTAKVSAACTATSTNYAHAVANASVTVGASVSAVTATVGTPVTSTLTISANAPTGGITFNLASDSTVATVPATVTVPSGSKTATFAVTPVGGGTTTLRATSNNITEADGTATVSFRASDVIKHIVVIFQENVSFDHYFATYPVAQNPANEPAFTAAAGTPVPAGLSGTLLTANPNALNATNGVGAVNPFRLDRSQADTGDQEHGYGTEQAATHNGAMDLFPWSVGRAESSSFSGAPAAAMTTGLTMGYYDGNTVTALWNYAQLYSMNDHFFETTFGPSTPGALNLISGQTNGVVADAGATGAMVADGYGGFSLVGDPDPNGDLCSNTGSMVHMTGKNVGDLLTSAGVSWGFFEAGFDLTVTNSNGSTGCGRLSASLYANSTPHDYVAHHQPFQYYASTANPNHTRPAAISKIGLNTDVANHQYDMHDFTDALAAGNMPAVTYLKAMGAQDGHAGYSDALDEQIFLVKTINAIQQSSFWPSTAIVIAYDDSDGWYDHMLNLINASATTLDDNGSVNKCTGTNATTANVLPGVAAGTLHAQGRCGYGPRLPLLVLSPWAKKNNLDSTVTDQSSILRLIEDTFLSGARIGGGSFDSIAGSLQGAFNFSSATPPNPSVVVLDPATGLVTSVH